MEKISTAELIKAVAIITQQPQKNVKEVIDALVAHIVGYTTNGNEVSLHGFGKFSPADRAARSCRSPLTKGATVEVPAKRVLVFRASATVREL